MPALVAAVSLFAHAGEGARSMHSPRAAHGRGRAGRGRAGLRLVPDAPDGQQLLQHPQVQDEVGTCQLCSSARVL